MIIELRTFTGAWATLKDVTFSGGATERRVWGLREFKKAHSHLLSYDPNTKTYKFPENVVLVVTDYANSLQRGGRFSGLDHVLVGMNGKPDRTVTELYDEFFYETTLYSAVVYVYPNCSEYFRMSPQLEIDAERRARRAAQHGCH